jgi:hypothetical protein
MTRREQQLIGAALDALHESESQLGDVPLHAELKLRVNPPPLLSEFETAMAMADAMRLVIGVKARFGPGKRWSITDQGEAARVEMQRG